MEQVQRAPNRIEHFVARLKTHRLKQQFSYVKAMPVRAKRVLFYNLRNSADLDVDTFFPRFGIFAGEFAIHQILSDYNRKSAPHST